MFQKATLRKMPPTTRRMAETANTLELSLNRLKKAIPIVRDMESDASLYNTQRGQIKYMFCSNPECRQVTTYVSKKGVDTPTTCHVCGAPLVGASAVADTAPQDRDIHRDPEDANFHGIFKNKNTREETLV
jgi:hypothetical protein